MCPHALGQQTSYIHPTQTLNYPRATLNSSGSIQYSRIWYSIECIHVRSVVVYYSMTVWILARNDINFSMAVGLIRLHMPGRQVISCVTKVSACHHTLHANHWHRLWKIPLIIAVKCNVTTFIKVLRFVVNTFIVVELLLPYLNMPVLKAWSSASRAQRPLTTGIVRRQFPSLRGTTWRDNGRSAWNGSRFEYICAFYVEINMSGVKLKMSCYNRD